MATKPQRKKKSTSSVSAIPKKRKQKQYENRQRKAVEGRSTIPSFTVPNYIKIMIGELQVETKKVGERKPAIGDILNDILDEKYVSYCKTK